MKPFTLTKPRLKALKSIHDSRRAVRVQPNDPIGIWPSVDHLVAVATQHASELRLGAELARHAKVQRKTIWRWRTGMDRPSPLFAKRIARWAEQESLKP